jgi:hypothetical protein
MVFIFHWQSLNILNADVPSVPDERTQATTIALFGPESPRAKNSDPLLLLELRLQL